MPAAIAEYPRFVRKFNEQIRFLQRSCKAYDEGEEEEAIRIALALRVIFYQKSSSVSLIRHLRFESKKMLSSSRGIGDWRDYLDTEVNLLSSQPVRMKPMMRDQFRPISIQDWWRTEPVFVHDSISYSRESVIPSMANKDGGAHVDADLQEYYKALCAGIDGLGITGSLEFDGPPPFPQGETIYANNTHLALLRQFAYEFLASVSHFNWLNGVPPGSI